MSRDAAHSNPKSKPTHSVPKRNLETFDSTHGPASAHSGAPPAPPAQPWAGERRRGRPQDPASAGSSDLGVAGPRAVTSDPRIPAAPCTPTPRPLEGRCHPGAQPVSGRPEPASGSHVCRPGRRLPVSPAASLVPTASSASKLPHLLHGQKLEERKDQMPVQKVRDARRQVVLRHLAGGKESVSAKTLLKHRPKADKLRIAHVHSRSR